METNINKLKSGLKKRGISEELFKIASANSIAQVIKEDWSQTEVTGYLLGKMKGKPTDYLLEGDEFLINELKKYEKTDNLDWYLNDYLDEIDQLYPRDKYLDLD